MATLSVNMWVNEEPCPSAATKGGVEQEWELGGTGERETVTLNMYQRQGIFCIAALCSALLTERSVGK